ncbi:TetR/AcrR family transcriptional regulator [Rhizobium sp. C4]|uniref:TetR/AcrR family transcriptional regulator n=1 Tax=Rhizobium sp. C4 TaxID=1349800 RepID=UPI001E47809C|nr:TetR/AcrR family transcriptional regulator [Rhizobium sp. C4]MCD2175506.1 TetR/AcrR family transcriptional regulator [Rhizobium sp. C4]
MMKQAPDKASKAAKVSPSEQSERAPRGERRKRETRTKLLRAAMSLMAERGLEAVAINEITEAADVGFGTFYNHFASKEEIYTCIVNWVFEAFADALERSLDDVSDSAEIIATSVRHTMNRAKDDPLWGRFLVREGMSARSMRGGSGLAGRLNRDIARGLKTGRFKASDSFVTFISVGATVLGAIVAELDASGDDLDAKLMENLPERTATLVLTILGIDASEATKIATAPLAAIDFQTAEIGDY